LSSEYIVASISFQGIGDESFESAESFCTTFVKHIAKALKNAKVFIKNRRENIKQTQM
jgi:hypothetical protein